MTRIQKRAGDLRVLRNRFRFSVGVSVSKHPERVSRTKRRCRDDVYRDVDTHFSGKRYRVAVVVAFSLNLPCNKTHPRDVKTIRGCANITVPPWQTRLLPLLACRKLQFDASTFLHQSCADPFLPLPPPLHLAPSVSRDICKPKNHANIGFNLRGKSTLIAFGRYP